MGLAGFQSIETSQPGLLTVQQSRRYLSWLYFKAWSRQEKIGGCGLCISTGSSFLVIFHVESKLFSHSIWQCILPVVPSQIVEVLQNSEHFFWQGKPMMTFKYAESHLLQVLLFLNDRCLLKHQPLRKS